MDYSPQHRGSQSKTGFLSTPLTWLCFLTVGDLQELPPECGLGLVFHWSEPLVSHKTHTSQPHSFLYSQLQCSAACRCPVVPGQGSPPRVSESHVSGLPGCKPHLIVRGVDILRGRWEEIVGPGRALPITCLLSVPSSTWNLSPHRSACLHLQPERCQRRPLQGLRATEGQGCRREATGNGEPGQCQLPPAHPLVDLATVLTMG